MSKHFLAIVLGVLLIGPVACKKSEPTAPAEPNKKETAVKAQPANVAAAPVAPASAPAAGGLDCDKLVPQAIRDKYLSGFKTVSKKQMNPFTTECKFTGESPADTVSLMFSCSDMMINPEVIKQATDQLKKLGYQDLPGLGRAAVKNGNLQISFWDDDTNCQVTVTGFGLKGDMVELARELGAALTPASTK